VALSGIELLDDTHRLEAFDCGKPALNAWLTGFARTNQARGFTRVLVVHDDGAVVGYYRLAPSVIQPNITPRAIRTGRPPDPIPCLLIGQLAVDRHYAGQGIGSGLVKDALRRCIAGAEIVGAVPLSSGRSMLKPNAIGRAGASSLPGTIHRSSCAPFRTSASGWRTRRTRFSGGTGASKPAYSDQTSYEHYERMRAGGDPRRGHRVSEMPEEHKELFAAAIDRLARGEGYDDES